MACAVAMVRSVRLLDGGGWASIGFKALKSLGF
jgi:hypothetical protein